MLWFTQIIEYSSKKTSSSPLVAATSQRYRLQPASESCIPLVSSTWDTQPFMKLMFAMSEWRDWGDTLPLEEFIMLSGSFPDGYPVASSTEPARVYFPIRLFVFVFVFVFKRWRSQFMEWRPCCKLGINVVLRIRASPRNGRRYSMWEIWCVVF